MILRFGNGRRRPGLSGWEVKHPEQEDCPSISPTQAAIFPLGKITHPLVIRAGARGACGRDATQDPASFMT